MTKDTELILRILASIALTLWLFWGLKKINSYIVVSCDR